MANAFTPTDLAYQNAGRYLTWTNQEAGTATVNGSPVAGNSGIRVADHQKAKVVVTPNSGATLNFRVWIEWEGRQGFALVDGLENVVTTVAWTQELNVSGASRLYVEITSIDVGSFDVDMGLATAEPRPAFRDALFAWRGTGDSPNLRNTSSYDGNIGDAEDVYQVLDYSDTNALLYTETTPPSWAASEQALLFDRSFNEYLTFQESRDLLNIFSSTAIFTVVIRIKFAEVSSDQGIFVQRTGSGTGLYFWMTAGNIEAKSEAGGDVNQWDVSAPVTAGTYYDVVVTGDGTNIEMYVDAMGTPASTAIASNLTGTLASSDASFGRAIGSNSLGAHIQGFAITSEYSDQSTREDWVRWVKNI